MKRRHEGFSNRSVLEFRQEEAVRFIAVKRRLGNGKKGVPDKPNNQSYGLTSNRTNANGLKFILECLDDLGYAHFTIGALKQGRNPFRGLDDLEVLTLV